MICKLVDRGSGALHFIHDTNFFTNLYKSHIYVIFSTVEMLHFTFRIAPMLHRNTKNLVIPRVAEMIFERPFNAAKVGFL
jgi:hypothetical protein